MAIPQERSLLPIALVALAMAAVAAPAPGRLVEIDAEIDGAQGVSGMGEATAVAVAPDGRHVYVVSHLPPGAIAVFARDVGSGVLRFVERHAHVPGGPALSFSLSVDVSPDGRHVYVAAYGASAISVFARDVGSGRLTFVEAAVSPDAWYSLYHVWSVRVSPDGAHVYAAVHGADQLVAFTRSATTGRLVFVQAVHDGDPGVSGLARPTAVAITPDGSQVYAIGAESDAVVLFDRAPATGVLTFVDAVATPRSPHAVELSADGKHAYVLGTGTGTADQALAIYERHPTSGVLTPSGVLTAGVEGATRHALDGAVALDPSGAALVVARAFGSTLSRFARDAGSGALTLVEEIPGWDPAALVHRHHVGGPVNGRFDPSGTTYYAASQFLHAVTAFRAATVACSAAPLACRTPAGAGRSVLSMRDKDPDRRDRLKWTWGKGATATDVAAFGDPVGALTDYALCLYEGTALAGEHLAAAAAECRGRPCWRAAPDGFAFSHAETIPDGLQRLTLKAGAAGAGSIKVLGKGALLDLPALPLMAPVTVQLQAATGECWGATFSTPSANAGGRYQAKSD